MIAPKDTKVDEIISLRLARSLKPSYAAHYSAYTLKGFHFEKSIGG